MRTFLVYGTLLGFALGPAAGAQGEDPILSGKVAFVRRVGKNLALYRLDLDSRKETMIFKNRDSVNSNVVQPRWVNNGQRIELSLMRQGKWIRASVLPDGSDLQNSTGETELPPVSNLIRGPGLEVPGDGKLRLNGKIIFDCAEDGDLDEFRECIESVSWRPETQWVIFNVCSSAGCDIWVAQKDGAKRIRLTEGYYPDLAN